MNSFQMRRFGLVLRCDLIENRRNYLSWLAGMYLACLFLICTNLYTPCRFGYPEANMDLHLHYLRQSVGRGILAVYMLCFFLGISDTFRVLRTKKERIGYLMLPAGQLEKFLSRLLIVGVFSVAGFALAAVAADLTRMLLFAPLKYHIGCSLTAIPGLMAEAFRTTLNPFTVADSPIEQAASVLFVYGTFLWHVSLYLLGGSLFRKRPFLLTFLAELCGGLLLIYLLSLTAPFNLRLSDTALRYVLLSIDCALFLLAVLNCLLAYRNFRRCPVISGKWLHR